MAESKFIGLDEAAEQLGVAKEKLNELREAGQLRAYRDGASWKFRTEEINKLGDTGLPSAADSGLGISGGGDDDALSIDMDDLGAITIDDDAPEEKPAAEAADKSDEIELDDLELDLDSDIGLAEPDTSGIDIVVDTGASDADLSNVEEPTVAADEPAEPLAADPMDEDLVLDAEGSGDDAESILLSEAELGDSAARPPSTIIGKNELAVDDDDDLQLAPSDSDAAAMSDVRLADDQDDNDVLSGEAAGSEIIPGSGSPPAGKFEDLEELEIDLEAESSRILEAEDVAAARAAQEKASSSGDSDLTLAPSDSDASLAGLSSLASDDESTSSDAGLTGISSLNVDDGGSGSLAGLSSIELVEDDDDDFVLGDSGSDITLSGGDSGINLVPSDSGISLDDASQILGGAAMGSSIDLGDMASGLGEAASASAQELQSADPEASEDFLLTPLGDDDEDDDEDSSQIISLDAVEEDDESADALLGGAVAVDMDEADGLEPAAAGAPAVVPDASFSVWNVVGLGCCLFMMTVCGMMMVDILRNMWSWQEPTTTSSALIEGLRSFFVN
ncbi:MAG: excisionase family DNA-binding protein [Planctomycetota bacterium]